MPSLNKKNLRKLILREIQKMEEDALYKRHKIGHDYRSSKHTSCMECGSAMYEGESVCEQCGAMYEEELNEGACGGCGTCATCGPQTSYMHAADNDLNDNFIPDHLEESDVENMLLNLISDELQQPEPVGHQIHTSKKHHGGAYMAKKQMYKVAKYAQKLYQIIPDGHDLEDWMRTKLAQISDDISEVYHALDHDKFEGDI